MKKIETWNVQNLFIYFLLEFILFFLLEFIFVSDMPITSGEYLTSVMNSSIKCLFLAKLLVLK